MNDEKLFRKLVLCMLLIILRTLIRKDRLGPETAEVVTQVESETGFRML